jgi:hypothetical protein
LYWVDDRDGSLVGGEEDSYQKVNYSPNFKINSFSEEFSRV